VSVCDARLTQLRNEASMLPADYISAEQRTRELDCLTRNIYWEAASEPFEGKVGVAQVTMNRVNSGKFASTVCGVVHQKNIIYEKVICQFSWYCEQPSKIKPMYPEAYNESMAVAKKVLLENFRLPSMKEAMYYHADYVNPRWGKPQVAKIGRHIFYRENR
jgi:spore germination cell wall hydrolase CwlJ-like protein